MSILDQGNINFSENQCKIDDITKLEKEYDNLYDEALILKDHPESKEYQSNKALRRVNLEKRKELVRG